MLKDFEKKFSKLPLAERHLLETRKVELFLQAADEGLEDRLLLLLGDRTTEGGFTNDWTRVEETITLLAKQRRVRSRDVRARIDVEPIQTPRAPRLSFEGKHRASRCNWFCLPDRRIFNFLQNFFNLSNLNKKNLSISATPSNDCCQQRLVHLFVDGQSLSPFYARANKLPSTQTSTTLFLLTLLQACKHSRENNRMKCNCKFYFRYLLQTTHNNP
jgi:hypothetical protein